MRTWLWTQCESDMRILVPILLLLITIQVLNQKKRKYVLKCKISGGIFIWASSSEERWQMVLSRCGRKMERGGGGGWGWCLLGLWCRELCLQEGQEWQAALQARVGLFSDAHRQSAKGFCFSSFSGFNPFHSPCLVQEATRRDNLHWCWERIWRYSGARVHVLELWRTTLQDC